MGTSLDERLEGKNAEEALIERISETFNLAPIFARTYLEEMPRLFAEHYQVPERPGTARAHALVEEEREVEVRAGGVLQHPPRPFPTVPRPWRTRWTWTCLYRPVPIGPTGLIHLGDVTRSRDSPWIERATQGSPSGASHPVRNRDSAC